MITTNSTASGNAGASSLTFSLTVNPGMARILLVAVAMEFSGQTITGVTFNGVPLTQAISASTNNEVRAYLFYLVNPPVTTANVVVSSSGSNNIIGMAKVFNGVDQINPIGATGTGGGFSASISVPITTTCTNSLVVDCLATGDSVAGNTADGSQTVIFDYESSPNDGGMSQKLIQNPGATTMDWTFSGYSGGGDYCAGVACALKPYVFGGGGAFAFL